MDVSSRYTEVKPLRIPKAMDIYDESMEPYPRSRSTGPTAAITPDSIEIEPRPYVSKYATTPVIPKSVYRYDEAYHVRVDETKRTIIEKQPKCEKVKLCALVGKPPSRLVIRKRLPRNTKTISTGTQTEDYLLRTLMPKFMNEQKF